MLLEEPDAPLRPDELPEGGSSLSRAVIVSAVLLGTLLLYAVVTVMG